MVVECARSCGTCQQRQRQHAMPLRPHDVQEPPGREDDLHGAARPCADRRRACSYWRGIGECERPGAQDSMKALCPATCGFCVQSEAERRAPTLERIVCAPSERDVHDGCEDWAAAGECRRNSEAMARACACACRQRQVLAKAAVAAALREGGTGEQSAAVTIGACEDHHERCPGWALIGVCTTTPLPMRRLCPRACGICGGANEKMKRAADLEAAADVRVEHAASDDLAATLGGHTRATGEPGRYTGERVAPQLHTRLEHWCREHTTAAHAPSSPAARPPPLPPMPQLMPMPLASVRLSAGSEFHAAQALNNEYLLSLPVDRLLWSFRRTAGLPTPGQPYGAWESAEGGDYPDPATPTRTLRGHFVGHLLSALAMGYAATGDVAFASRSLTSSDLL